MADTEEEKTLSEIVVTELVEQGMDSPMRDSILEAVEASEGGSTGGSGSLPLAGALFGLGAAVGYLAGRESPELEDTSLEDIQEPEIIEDITEDSEEAEEADTETEADAEAEEPASSSGRLSRLLLVLGVLAGIAVLRRRFASGEDEEWEPIEEFEPATDLDEDETEDEEEGEEVEAETGDETEE